MNEPATEAPAGWTFVVRPLGDGLWECTGTHPAGRELSRRSSDPGSLLVECWTDARRFQMTAEEEFVVDQMAAVDPELAALLATHRDEYEGLVIPYLFMNEVMHWALGHNRAGEVAFVTSLLSRLEELYVVGNKETRDYIAVAFLEGMDDSMRDYLGPMLAEEYRQVNGLPESNRVTFGDAD